jgi:RsiW-degrading membrane proteinase PrsW (M82 family)
MPHPGFVILVLMVIATAFALLGCLVLPSLRRHARPVAGVLGGLICGGVLSAIAIAVVFLCMRPFSEVAPRAIGLVVVPTFLLAPIVIPVWCAVVGFRIAKR